MPTDPSIVFVFLMMTVVIAILIVERFRQPHVIGYLLAGIVLGPHVFNVVKDQALLNKLGDFGVVLLLFFSGMEVSPKKLISNWLVPVLGVPIQILLTILVISVIDIFLDKSAARIFLFACMLSLSSTAIVINLLEDWKELDTRIGQSVLSILVVQDLAVVAMVIILGLLSSQQVNTSELLLQLMGGLAFFGIGAYLLVKETIRLPFLDWIIDNKKDIEIFAALIICLSLSIITGLLKLSSALGAFIAGMIVSAAKETGWVKENLSSIKTLFTALFFVSIGMRINVNYIWHHLGVLLLFVFFVYFINTIINALMLVLLKVQWKEALYTGALLSQIGEFSFLLVSIGRQYKIVHETHYQFIIALVAMTLMLSPLWINLIRRAILPDGERVVAL